jgi:hypothetical protein
VGSEVAAGHQFNFLIRAPAVSGLKNCFPNHTALLVPKRMIFLVQRTPVGTRFDPNHAGKCLACSLATGMEYLTIAVTYTNGAIAYLEQQLGD